MKEGKGIMIPMELSLKDQALKDLLDSIFAAVELHSEVLKDHDKALQQLLERINKMYDRHFID